MSSNLGIHLRVEMDNAKISQLQFAGRIGLRQSTINAIINTGARPQPDSMAAIVRYDWPERSTGINLLMEHLRDEITRAQLKKSHPTARILMRSAVTDRPEIDHVLDSIRAHARSNPDLLRLLSDLLIILGEQREELPMVAEEKAKYTVRKK